MADMATFTLVHDGTEIAWAFQCDSASVSEEEFERVCLDIAEQIAEMKLEAPQDGPPPPCCAPSL